MSQSTLVVTKIINASREELFEAFTNPDIMIKWFYADADVSVEVSNTLELGGGYTLNMLGRDGVTYKHVGEYREIIFPEKLVFTWNTDFVQDTVVTITFSEMGSRTKVTIAHDLLPSKEMTENHGKGWIECLNRLESTLVG